MGFLNFSETFGEPFAQFAVQEVAGDLRQRERVVLMNVETARLGGCAVRRNDLLFVAQVPVA